MSKVCVKNVSFQYNKNHPILKNVSIDFVPHKVNLLLGLNGCGKTTLIKLVAGLFKCGSGNIEYDGLNLKNIKYKERAKIFSYVPQYTANINDFTVREYLSFSLNNEVAIGRKPSKIQMERTLLFANKLNLNNMLDKLISELSGGERQLVSICGALVQNTDVIILDEPTSALDLKNQQIVLTCLKEIAEKENKTIIMSAHNPNFALYLDANVILLDSGSVYSSGSSTEIVSKDKLKSIYGNNICYSKDLQYKEISFK